MSPLSLGRAFVILAVAIRFGLDEFLLPRARELGIAWLVPARWRTLAAPRGERLRLALEALGPVFVKLGQLLSVRPDLIPEDITDELADLRDHVAPISGESAVQAVERAYDAPVNEVFASFDPTPLASASIAQVHSAKLPAGDDVVVKIVRPGIERVIARDIRLLRVIARVAERFGSTARRLRALEVIDEYESIIGHELDMFREAANASQLGRNFEDSELLRVPVVHWDFTRRNILVLERVHGIPLDQIDALVEAGVDLKKLAERGVEIFFRQVFTHNFFHADMHPGNIFVDPAPDDNGPRYIAIDFGIMGSLGRADQRYLAENFLAFFNRDYRRVAELHISSGWVPHGARVEAFEAEIRSVCEPIFEKPLGEIAFAPLLVRLFQTARRFDMTVQPQLVLLQKTLLHIEGLGRQLYPELDLWANAKPFFERWVKTRLGPRAALDALQSTAPRLAALAVDLGPSLPDLLEVALRPAPPPPAPSPERVGVKGLAVCLIGLGFIVGSDVPEVGWLLLGVGAALAFRRSAVNVSSHRR